VLRDGFVGLVASSPSSPSSEIGSTFDDLAVYGEALVLGRFAVFVVKDRPGRHALTVAATLRSP
jgi:hypothetical protein